MTLHLVPMHSFSSVVLWRGREEHQSLQAVQEDETRNVVRAEPEDENDGCRSSASFSSGSSSSMSDEHLQELESPIPETIMIPNAVSRAVSIDQEDEEHEKSELDLHNIFESSGASSQWMTNEEEPPRLAYEPSWTTASISTPRFLFEEDDMSLESLPVAAKLATSEVWN